VRRRGGGEIEGTNLPPSPKTDDSSPMIRRQDGNQGPAMALRVNEDKFRSWFVCQWSTS
jgi:hypothetical protein